MTRPPARAALSLLLACAGAPAALAALDPKTDRQVGGVFSNACQDRAQVMIRLYGDVLDIERAGKAVQADRLKSVRTPPPGAAAADFAATVTGQVKGGSGTLTLTITHNARGLFARIDGDERALAPLGPGVAGQTLRHCDPNRNAQPGTTPATTHRGPPDLLKDTRFKAAYLKALGPLAREPWISAMEGPAPALRQVKLATGDEYTLAATCKPRDCAEHNLIVLWRPQSARVLALVQQRGRKTPIGTPNPDELRQLEKLWAAEWQRR